MEQYVNFQKHSDQNGLLITAVSNGVQIHLHFANTSSAIDALTNEVATLKNSVLAFGERAPQLMETLSEKGWKAKAQTELSPVATAFRALRDAALKRRAELENRRLELLKPLAPIDPMRAYEIRQWVRSQKPADVIPSAIKNPEIGAAILQFKALSGISDDLLLHIENALIKQNLMARYAVQTPLKPTPDNVLANGIDAVELNTIADKAVENFQLGLSELQNVEGILNRTVNFYAIAALVTRADAFEIIMRRNA